MGLCKFLSCITCTWLGDFSKKALAVFPNHLNHFLKCNPAPQLITPEGWRSGGRGVLKGKQVNFCVIINYYMSLHVMFCDI